MNENREMGESNLGNDEKMWLFSQRMFRSHKRPIGVSLAQLPQQLTWLAFFLAVFVKVKFSLAAFAWTALSGLPFSLLHFHGAAFPGHYFPLASVPEKIFLAAYSSV